MWPCGKLWPRCRHLTPAHCCLAPRETGTVTRKFKYDGHAWGYGEFIELSELTTAKSGWLVNDALVLRVVVSVEREDRFQLDTGEPFGCVPSVCPASHAQ
jgi:hypothetical protein